MLLYSLSNISNISYPLLKQSLDARLIVGNVFEFLTCSNIFFKTWVSAVWRWNFRCLYFHPVVHSCIAEDSFTFPLYIQEYGRTWYSTLLPVFAYRPCKKSILFLNSGTLWTWFTATPSAQTWILYSRVAPASAVEEILHWNNPINREALGLVRKGGASE